MLSKQHGNVQLFAVNLRRKIMTVKTIIVAIALLLGAAPAALAQSAYTTGTISNSQAAGYPS
ncbi:MAG TPA: hypothetical protein VGJ20_10950 [Xanthobacteraceae bacterium]